MGRILIAKVVICLQSSIIEMTYVKEEKSLITEIFPFKHGSRLEMAYILIVK